MTDTVEEKGFFNKVSSLAIFLAVITCVQGMFCNGVLVTALSSIEHRFGKGFIFQYIRISDRFTGVRNSIIPGIQPNDRRLEKY